MSEPTVCCVCLTADRQSMTDRAVRSFLAQDYADAALVILDTGNRAWTPQFDLNMSISNPGAWDKLKPGEEYYIDFIPVNKAA